MVLHQFSSTRKETVSLHPFSGPRVSVQEEKASYHVDQNHVSTSGWKLLKAMELSFCREEERTAWGQEAGDGAESLGSLCQTCTKGYSWASHVFRALSCVIVFYGSGALEI